MQHTVVLHLLLKLFSIRTVVYNGTCLLCNALLKTCKFLEMYSKTQKHTQLTLISLPITKQHLLT